MTGDIILTSLPCDFVLDKKNDDIALLVSATSDLPEYALATPTQMVDNMHRILSIDLERGSELLKPMWNIVPKGVSIDDYIVVMPGKVIEVLEATVKIAKEINYYDLKSAEYAIKLAKTNQEGNVTQLVLIYEVFI